MLIRSQSGMRIIHAYSVKIEKYSESSGKYALRATWGHEEAGYPIGLYHTFAEAQAALDHIFSQAAKGTPVDLTIFNAEATHQ